MGKLTPAMLLPWRWESEPGRMLATNYTNKHEWLKQLSFSLVYIRVIRG